MRLLRKRHTAASRRETLLWLDRLSRWLLAAVMVVAAVPKLLKPASFAQVIDAYGLLPEFFALPLAVTLPAIELIAAYLLLKEKKSGLLLTTGLMVLFMAVLLHGIWLGLDIDCGCFGPDDPEHSAFSGLRSALVRDILLCLPLMYCYWYTYRFSLNLCGEKK